MLRRVAPVLLLLLAALAACSRSEPPGDPGVAPAAPARWSEFDVASLQAAMQAGEVTAAGLVDFYLARIDAIDRAGPELRSVIEINPEARQIAAALDRERAATGPRGPLHGIPVVLKANIDTGDRMATSAGSLALADHRAPDDAFLVSELRAAGAVILGKANLSEWANFRSDRSSSGWSSLGGQTRNPYSPRRNPCGSSSGSAVAVAANLTALAVGTETDGSIVCPAGLNGIVGIKPTLGLVSRDGIIPIAHSQDTAGPMARTVRGAALMLDAMSARDPSDPAATGRPAERPVYASALEGASLEGKRIGVIRSHYGAGSNPYVDRVLQAALDTLRAGGAVIVDDVAIDTEGMDDAEYEVLLYEFKADLNAYLAESGAPMATIDDVIAFNEANADAVMPFFGQDIMLSARDKGPLTEAAYRDALDTSKRIARDAIDGALAADDLDALVAPTNGPAWMTDHVNGDHFGLSSSSLAAVAGYASITVPAGQVFGLPVGVSFIGGAWSEPGLIGIAHAFEQASRARRPPSFLEIP